MLYRGAAIAFQQQPAQARLLPTRTIPASHTPMLNGLVVGAGCAGC